MTNVRNGNTYYIDTGTVSLTAAGKMLVSSIVLTSTGASIASLVLADNDATTYTKKLQVAAPAGATTVVSLVLAPILFPNGVRVVSITNGVATLVVTEGQ